MYILAIETTGAKCSVAVINEKKEAKELSCEGNFIHLQKLMPLISELMDEAKINIEEIDAIAASCGPGSFTGIRIGVTTARALAQGLNKVAIAVPTLESFAYHYENCSYIICPILDARRSQVYAGAYTWEDGECIEVIAGGAYSVEEYQHLLKNAVMDMENRKIVLVGDGVKSYGEKIVADIAGTDIKVELIDELQKASSVAKLGLKLYNEGKVTAYGGLKPEYMREAEAQRKLNEKLQKEGNC